MFLEWGGGRTTHRVAYIGVCGCVVVVRIVRRSYEASQFKCDRESASEDIKNENKTTTIAPRPTRDVTTVTSIGDDLRPQDLGQGHAHQSRQRRCCAVAEHASKWHWPTIFFHFC